MNTRNVAIIQARMGSSRFPGKMLARLGGIPLVEWVIRRTLRSSSLAQVILATSDRQTDDDLADLAAGLGILVFRGSENDVLDRFAGAARLVAADNVVRICADNPFIDPDEIDRLVSYFAKNPCDYSCNHQNRLNSNYADGFGAEIFSASLLEKMIVNSTEARHREHVTLCFWDHSDVYNLTAVPAPESLAFPRLRFDVDTPKDLSRLEELIRAGVSIKTKAAEIIRIAQLNCTNTKINTESVTHSEISKFLKRLFPLCRSITGDANRQTLKALQEIIPLTIHELQSGTHVYDWTIPDEWNIQDAWIAEYSGRRIIDFKVSNLHVVSYSEPVKSIVNWDELKSHLHVHPLLAEAIPYRTSYYKRDWGFCVTKKQYEEIEKLKGPFTVVIDSEFKSGYLTYGEYIIRGRSPHEILISCYICHPSMANDSLSGVLLTAFLARYISSMVNRQWTYRIVFVPETIGAIAYCAQNASAIKKIDMALVITTVGGPGKFGYKQSFNSTHPINAMIEQVFKEAETEFVTYPFDIHGSDERQYSSQGFRINTATICRDRYYEYDYYHSSLDNLDFVTAEQICETLDLYCRLIDKFEARRIYRNRIPHCEVMLSRHDLYPVNGGAQRPEQGGLSELDLILWLLFYCDGKLDIASIAKEIGVPLSSLMLIVDQLVSKNILEIV